MHGSVIVVMGRFLHHGARRSCAGANFRPDLSGISHGGYDGDGSSILTVGHWAEPQRHRDGCADDVFHPHRCLLLPCSRDGNLFK